MSILDKIGKVEGGLAFWERVLRWGPMLLGTTLTGSITGWASVATEALSRYSPISWIASAVFGGCAFLLSAWLWSAARVNAARLEYARDQMKKTPSFNPLEEIFTKQRIDLQAFRTQFNEVVSNKTFVDCELSGPAVIFLTRNISLTGVAIGACEFVRVRDGAEIYNSIGFADFTVTRGKMRGLTILVPESHVSLVDAGVKGIKWVTHNAT